MIARLALEKSQVFIYLVALLAGLFLGARVPEVRAPLEATPWPALALLLYATFTQVPLARLRGAFVDFRFIGRRYSATSCCCLPSCGRCSRSCRTTRPSG